jgi:mono/diheme cytochrome c family protein
MSSRRRARASLVTATLTAAAAATLLLAAPDRAQQPGEGQGSGPVAPGPQAAQPSGGAAVYTKYCAQCHGDKGDGRGIAAPFLLPAPRDFTTAKYQIRSTETGALPTADDIKRVIQRGIPGTAMPGFQEVGDVEQQLDALVAHLQSFSPRFQTQKLGTVVPIPDDPGYSADRLEEARKVYKSIGCEQCHGDEGRGDGPTAPTLKDDWGQQIRAADLSMPWTFNGGATREDIFRSISTGLNGTPMAGFASALSDEQRWQLVDFIQAQAGGETEVAPYANMVVAKKVDGPLDLARGKALFEDAERAMFPTLGQVIQPGRDFAPGVVAVEARAVYNRDEVALLVTWHDIRADIRGNNGPDFELPAEEDHPGLEPMVSGGGQAPDPFAEEEQPASADPFADEEQAPSTQPSADPFADEVVAEPTPPSAGAPSDDFGREPNEGGDGAAAASAGAPGSAFSDAVAVQFPRRLPDGVRLPYFLFGDLQNPVELWFVDLASPDRVELWEGRGTTDLSPGEGVTPEGRGSFTKGEWSVILKRKRDAGSGIAFPDDTFVPIAFSVWDGFHRERGNMRALTTWYNLYLPPAETPSPWMPMAKAAGVVLLAELLVIGLVRRRARRRTAAGAATATSAGTA